MLTLKGTDINHVLKTQKRVYLCGKLTKPNGLQHIQTDGYEMGITDYPQFKCDYAHLHTNNREFNYVLTGEVKVYIFSEHKEYHFQTGDLYVIEPNMPYIVKARANSKVLFTKSPGGNDKVLTPDLETQIGKWKKEW